MKPGLVLSDEQCHKKFGPRKGVKDDRFSKPASKHRFGESNLEEMEETDIDDPGTPMQQEVINENDYSVLIDANKSFEEQNRIGRQLFVSLISTGSVSSQKMTESELETHKNIDEDLAMLTSSLLERQVRNSRKFLSFTQDKAHKSLFLPNGKVNVSNIVDILVQQTVLVLKQNQDFKSLSVRDQTELLETNAMVVTIIFTLELYSPNTHTIAWPLTEQDYRALQNKGVQLQGGRVSVGLSTALEKVEHELSDDMVKLFKYFDYFSHIGVNTAATNLLAISVIFSHDCCDVENRERLEQIRRHYLILLFESLCHSEGILGACNIGLRLHTAIHHLSRICQLMMQKFVTVQE